jgi:hypothetical protein
MSAAEPNPRHIAYAQTGTLEKIKISTTLYITINIDTPHCSVHDAERLPRNRGSQKSQSLIEISQQHDHRKKDSKWAITQFREDNF